MLDQVLSARHSINTLSPDNSDMFIDRCRPVRMERLLSSADRHHRRYRQTVSPPIPDSAKVFVVFLCYMN